MSVHLMQERRSYIEKRLLAEGSIKISDLTRFFDVSSETIRKDLLYLENKGVAKKAYGGAVSVSSAIEPSFKEKTTTNFDEKSRIAAAALDHIESGMSLILDAGSTVFALAKALAIKHDITVFTNGLKAAQVLDEYGITTHLLGGRIRHNSNSIVGSWAQRNLREIRVDLAVLGTSGFCERTGPCVENFPEAELKGEMIRSSSKAVVLSDSSKATRRPVIQYAKWSEIDALITDDKIGGDALENIKKQTSVIIV